MLHASVTWTLYTAAKRAREHCMFATDSLRRKATAVKQTLQRLVSAAWVEHANRANVPWKEWHEEQWVSKPAAGGRPTVRILTATYAAVDTTMPLTQHATHLYTDGSWVAPDTPAEWTPARWGVAEFTPTADTHDNAFPLSQWTSTGPADDNRAELTWVDHGEVCTEPGEAGYVGAAAHTNNTGEITAMYHALRRAAKRPERTHVIHSDSLYTIHMTTGKWMPRRKGVRNRVAIDAVRRLYRMQQRRGAGIHLRHVRSHTRVPGNELADQLAGEGGTLSGSRQWLRGWIARQQTPGGLGDAQGDG